MWTVNPSESYSASLLLAYNKVNNIHTYNINKIVKSETQNPSNLFQFLRYHNFLALTPRKPKNSLTKFYTIIKELFSRAHSNFSHSSVFPSRDIRIPRAHCRPNNDSDDSRWIGEFAGNTRRQTRWCRVWSRGETVASKMPVYDHFERLNHRSRLPALKWREFSGQFTEHLIERMCLKSAFALIIESFVSNEPITPRINLDSVILLRYRVFSTIFGRGYRSQVGELFKHNEPLTPSIDECKLGKRNK